MTDIDQRIQDVLAGISCIPGCRREDGELDVYPSFSYWRVPGDGSIRTAEGFESCPRYVCELRLNRRDPKTVARFSSAVRELGCYSEDSVYHDSKGIAHHPFRVTICRKKIAA